jgi:2-C-methyl-D-erythritol 4-phosphate cytidylyltransferase
MEGDCNNMDTAEAVIFAGGVGRRMSGSTRPKQFLELSGRPIIDYTISCFALHPQVSHLVVSCLESWIPFLEDWLSNHRYSVPIDIVLGGRNGQESIYNGIKLLRGLHPGDKDAIVLIHDGVRPLIDKNTISACIASARDRGPTATTALATETVVQTCDDGSVGTILPRSQCELARAPQAFRLVELYAAHLRAIDEGKFDFIDSISMMSYYGYKIYTVEGPAENIKVTTPMDYFAFKGFMEARDQELMWKK